MSDVISSGNVQKQSHASGDNSIETDHDVSRAKTPPKDKFVARKPPNNRLVRAKSDLSDTRAIKYTELLNRAKSFDDDGIKSSNISTDIRSTINATITNPQIGKCLCMLI